MKYFFELFCDMFKVWNTVEFIPSEKKKEPVQVLAKLGVVVKATFDPGAPIVCKETLFSMFSLYVGCS